MAKKTEQSKAHGSIGVIAIFLIAALLGFVVRRFVFPSAMGSAVAKVTVNNEVVATLPLDVDTREVITTEVGTNTIVVKDRAVHIEDADCPGGDCMKQGEISQQGRLLVCLPHKLIVEIEADEGTMQPSEYTGNEVVGGEGYEGIDVVAK